MGRSMTPTAVMPSTTSSASVRRVTSASAGTGWSAQVEVSLACTKTARTRGCSSSAVLTASGRTARPHSTTTSRTVSP